MPGAALLQCIWAFLPLSTPRVHLPNARPTVRAGLRSMRQPAVAFPATGGPTQRGDESCMAQKVCGTCVSCGHPFIEYFAVAVSPPARVPIPGALVASLPEQGGSLLRSQDSAVQDPLRWGVSSEIARDIGCYNREGAEPNLFFTERLEFTRQLGWQRGVDLSQIEPIVFYDSVSAQPLFVAPMGRTMDDFLSESLRHGWPSFRQSEVVWEHVRVLDDFEVVSTAGTHLGHAMAPDAHGPRYCINLCTIAGVPALEAPAAPQLEADGLGSQGPGVVRKAGPTGQAASRLERLWPTLHEIAASGEWRGYMHYASGPDGMTPAPFTLEGTMRVTLSGRRCTVASTIVLPDGNERQVTMAGDLGGEADGGGANESDKAGVCVARLERAPASEPSSASSASSATETDAGEARGPISLLLAEHSAARSILLRELNTTSGEPVLSSSLVLLGGGDAPLELVQTAHELIQPGGGIGGVQLWRMRPVPPAEVTTAGEETDAEEGRSRGANERAEALDSYPQDEEAFMYSGSEL